MIPDGEETNNAKLPKEPTTLDNGEKPQKSLDYDSLVKEIKEAHEKEKTESTPTEELNL